MTERGWNRASLAFLLAMGGLLLVLAGDFVRGQLERRANAAIPPLPIGLTAAHPTPAGQALDQTAPPTVLVPTTAAPTAILTATAPLTPPMVLAGTTELTPTPTLTSTLEVTATDVLTLTEPLTATPTTAAALPPLSAMRIPTIALARTIVPAMFDVAHGWDVPKYQVGHHDGSGQPGDGTNIVLNGHVGGSDPVFDRLIELQAGDTIILYRGDTPYLYAVTEAIRIQVVGADPAAVAAEAARWLGPSASEAVTLITCWPPSGPNAYDQRLIVRALPQPR